MGKLRGLVQDGYPTVGYSHLKSSGFFTLPRGTIPVDEFETNCCSLLLVLSISVRSGLRLLLSGGARNIPHMRVV